MYFISTEVFLYFHFTLQLHHAVVECFRTRRATGNVDIHRQNLVHTVHHVIGFLERASADGTAAYGYYIFRIGHLVVKTFQNGSHLVGYCSANHNHVCLARTGTGYLEPEARHIVAGCAEGHEFDTATAGCKRKRPQ